MTITVITFYKACEQSDIGRLPPTSRQAHPNLVQLVPQHLEKSDLVILRCKADADDKADADGNVDADDIS